jgi:hypothetical protein
LGRTPGRTVAELECCVCGTQFVTPAIWRVNLAYPTCSKSCTKRFANWRKGIVSVTPVGVKVDRRTAAKVQSRARKLRHALTWDGITDEEIFERDGWRCQVPGCKKREIRRDLKYPDPRFPSIDHIVPLSLGGDDTAANKRASHLRCNVARGNQMDCEQLPLFGVIREAPMMSVVAGRRVVERPVKPKPQWAQRPVVTVDCYWCGRDFETIDRGPRTAQTCGTCHNCSGCGQRVAVVVGKSLPPDERLCRSCRAERAP